VEKFKEKAFLTAFGSNLRKLRKSKGYTQEDLANELGIEISQISRIERGKINTSIYMVRSLSLALGCSIEVLFELDK